MKSPTKGWHKQSPKTKSERKRMLQRCGKKCFLKPSTLGYPICPKGSCSPSQKGLESAYVRARQFKHQAIAKKAKSKMKRRSPRRKSPRRRSRRKSPRRRSRRRSPRRRSRRRSPRRRSRRRLKGAGCIQPAMDDQRTLAYRYRKNFSRWPASWNPCASCDCINMVPTAENRRKSGIKMAKGFKKDCLSCAEDYMNAYNFYKGTPGEAQARKRLERAIMMAEKASRIYNAQPKSAYTDLDPTDL
jgi:hypothetical protein